MRSSRPMKSNLTNATCGPESPHKRDSIFVKHLVIFDVDGTLCDTLSVDDECFCATASTLLDVSIESWEGSPHITDSGILEWLWTRHLGRSPTRQEIDAEAVLVGLRDCARDKVPEPTTGGARWPR